MLHKISGKASLGYKVVYAKSKEDAYMGEMHMHGQTDTFI